MSGLARALIALEALIALRLEERGATSAGAAGPPRARLAELLRRPLGLEGDEGLPPAEAFAAEDRLAELVDAYELSVAETVAIVAAVAPEVDEKFDVLYANLGDRPETAGLTGEVLRTLIARSFEARVAAADLLAPAGKLRGLRMLDIDPGAFTVLAGRVRINPELAAWLLERRGHEPEFSPEFPATRLRTVHRFDDIVVPADVRGRLRQVLERIRDRERVLDEWGLARRHDNAAGFHVLFHGPPGTGKTMAAAVLGRETGRPVYRVDLSLMVSKYIGETEKNLTRIFDRAEARDWILFLDEADSVLGSRGKVTEARDNWANQTVSHVLVRLETFSGVTILATNLRRNIDDAFTRRIHADVAFPKPSERERTALWSTVIPPELPLDSAVDLRELARAYELTGAEIRNAVFHAAHRACADGGVVLEEHLREGVRVEYEKSGRLFEAGA